MLEQEEHELVVGGQTPPLTCTAETPSPHAPVPCNVMGLWASLLGGESAAPCRLTSQRAEQEQAGILWFIPSAMGAVNAS